MQIVALQNHQGIGKIAVASFLFCCLALSYYFQSHWVALAALFPILLPGNKIGEEFTLVILISVAMVARDLPFDQLIPLLYLLQFKRVLLSRRNLWVMAYLALIIFYSFLFLLFNIDEYKVNLDSAIVTGLTHGVPSAIVWYLVLSNWRGGVESLFRALALAYGIIFIAFLAGANNQMSEDYVLLTGVDQFIVYTLGFLYFSKRWLLFVAAMILLVLIFTANVFSLIYVSSSAVWLVLVAVFLSLLTRIQYRKLLRESSALKIILPVMLLFLSLSLVSYERLTNMGFSPLLSYKIMQPVNTVSNIIDDGLTTSSAPDVLTPSLLVRYIALVNIAERPLLLNFIGSGLFSFFEETSISLYGVTGRGYEDATAYSDDQIFSGQFYRPHNTARGFLHYGILYFVIVAAVYYQSLRALRKTRADAALFYFLALLFLNALWNPYISSIALLAFSSHFLKPLRTVKSRQMKMSDT